MASCCQSSGSSSSSCLSREFSQVESILLVTAHPDDEVMFFSPLLQYAADHKRRVSVLCLSTGNFDGLGDIRKKELIEACGAFKIEPEDIEVVDDPRLQDGMDEDWPVEVVAMCVLSRLLKQPTDMVVSFDCYGVSGHPNHIAVSNGVIQAVKLFERQSRHGDEHLDPSTSSGRKSAAHRAPILGVMLESTGMLRKYLGLTEVLFSAFWSSGDLAVVNTQPWRVYSAMALHYSQFVWFRRFFVCFSRYTYVNSFRLFTSR